jgi:SWI/SNF-related matrix-associated actin-dependent regulator of chromatin subfamily A3
MEPQFNPAVEEQALDRVHRIGQTQAVSTIRFVMRDSFEENIVSLQRRKKQFAELALAQGPVRRADYSRDLLQVRLKSIVLGSPPLG